MSNRKFIADLSSTEADIRILKSKKIDTKKIYLNGEDILNSIPTVNHQNDTRDTITEDDLWGEWVEKTTDNQIFIHNDEVINPNKSKSSAWNTAITKVENNKAYINDSLFGNIQTSKIKDGRFMFKSCNALTSFNSDLSNLVDGHHMFIYCKNLESVNSDLSNLDSAYYMFRDCVKLPSFNGDLSSLTNGYYMFVWCLALTSFKATNLDSLTNGFGMFCKCNKLSSFVGDLSNLVNGVDMFVECGNLTSLYTDSRNTPLKLPNLANGFGMFQSCTKLTTFNTDVPSLLDGQLMFALCNKLKTVDCNLSNLLNGRTMFLQCPNLKSFSCDISKLTNGYGMFYESGIESFNSNLNSLVYGFAMFMNDTKFKTFACDLPNLVDGYGMFYNTGLESFSGDLSSLIKGSFMFGKTKLNPNSVMMIAHSINDINAEKELYTSGAKSYVTVTNGVYSASKGFMSDGSYVYSYHDSTKDIYYEPKFSLLTYTIPADEIGYITLSINVVNDATTIEEQLQAFAEEANFNSWEDLKQMFIDKGWTVTFKYSSDGETITYGLRDGERLIPMPIYAKLIESSENSSSYTNEDESMFYNIDWGHEVTDMNGYTQFDSIEDAISHWGLHRRENVKNVALKSNILI